MDQNQLITLINASPILADDERAYWLANLGKMTPIQMQELESILASGTPAFDQAMDKIFEVLTPVIEAAIKQSDSSLAA